MKTKTFRRTQNVIEDIGKAITLGTIPGCACATFVVAIGAAFIGLVYLAKIVLF